MKVYLSAVFRTGKNKTKRKYGEINFRVNKLYYISNLLDKLILVDKSPLIEVSLEQLE